MIGNASLRLVQAATLSAALMMSTSAFAQDETTRQLTEHLLAVEALSTFGENLKELISTDIGFSEAQVTQWSSAVDVAFDRDTLEAEFFAALDSRLSDPVRQAALDYQTSPLGVEVFERVNSAPSNADAPHLVDEAKTYLEEASDERRALHEAHFEAESGSAQYSASLEGYFRAMKIAAAPILGEAAAEQWVTDAQYLREVYAENSFLTSVSIYSQMPEERHEELVAHVTTPEVTAFYSLSTEALAETINAALDRVEAAYADGSN